MNPRPPAAAWLDPDLQAWADELRLAGMSEHTIRSYTGAVRRCAQASGVRPRDLTAIDIAVWLRGGDWSAWTLVAYDRGLRMWARWAKRRRVAPKGMTRGLRRPVPPPPDPDPITVAQWRALRAQVRGDDVMTAAVLLGGLAGLRVHEIAKVRAEDLDPWRGMITVRGKGGRQRVVPADARIVRHARRMPASGWWFPHTLRPAEHRPPTSLGESIALRMRRAGIHDGHPHQLRAFLATELSRAGLPLPEVSRMLGHASVRTTQIYIRADVERLRAALPLVAA